MHSVPSIQRMDMLKKNRKARLKKLLSPFNLSIGKKQDLGTILKVLRKAGVSYDTVISYVDNLREKKIKEDGNLKATIKKIQEKWKEKAVKCPDCETIMTLFNVNTRPNNQVNGEYKSAWQCPECEFENYNKKTTQEVIKGLDL